MRKSKKAIIIFGIILLILAAAVVKFIADGNQIISGVVIHNKYGEIMLANDKGNLLRLDNFDNHDKYSDGDRIIVVCGENMVLYGGMLYEASVDVHFTMRTEKGDFSDVEEHYRNTGRNLLSGRFLRSKNGDLMLIDDNGSAYELCILRDDIRPEYYNHYGDGDEFLAVCGDIREIYPAQADMHYCWLVEDGDYSDLPESTLDSLREMGWID